MIIFFLLVVLIIPYGYHIDLGPGPNGLFSVLWDSSDHYGLRLFASLEYFPYYLFRFIVFYVVIKYINNKSSKKRLLLYGLIAELIPLLISIPGALFLNPEGENYIPIMISIPILLLSCIFLSLFWNLSNEDIKNNQM